MYPQQPSNDPNQGSQYFGGQHPGGQHPGGQYPGGQYPPESAQYGGYPPPPPYVSGPGAPGPVKMPGAAITVRVLMFIGGVCGLLFGGLMWLAAAMAAGDSQFSEDFRSGMQDGGLPLSGADAGMFFGVLGAIPFLYGAVSITLASLMGRRSPGILWSVVAFQVLAALILLFSVVTGSFGAVIPLIFTIVMIALMLLAGTRAYYSRPTPYAY